MEHFRFFEEATLLKHERVASFSLVVHTWLNMSVLTERFTYCLRDEVELSR